MSEVLDVIIKATLGGIVVGMIFYLVDTLGPKSAAILSFAPVFTITGILLVSGEADSSKKVDDVHTYILGMIIPFLFIIIFCLIAYYLIDKLSIIWTMTISLITWFLLTGLYMFLVFR